MTLSSHFRMAGFLGACAVLSLTTASAAEGWLTDFEAAKKQATTEKKDILIDFTGSDWCGWCIKLNEEVFNKDAFKKAAPKDFVFLELDFPQRKKLDEKLQKQNQKLQEEFGVQGFPTIFLTDGKGRPYAQTGYQPGGPEKYLTHLADLQKKRVERDKHFAKAKKAKGLDRAKHLSAGLDVLKASYVFPAYEKIVAKIIELDAKNEAGLKKTYEKKKTDFALRAEVSKVERAVMKAMQTGGDTAAAMKQLEDVLKKTGGKGEAAQKLYLIQAQVGFQQSEGKDVKSAVKLLRKAVEADPKSDIGQNLVRVIAQLEEKAKADAEKAKDDAGDEK